MRKLLWYFNFTVISLSALLNDNGSDNQILALMLLPFLIISYKYNFKERE